MTNNLTPEQQAVIDEIAGRLSNWEKGYHCGDLRTCCRLWLEDMERTGLIQPKEEE